MAVRAFAAAFVVLTASYGLFAGRLSVAEGGLALGGGALAALWWLALSRAARIRFRFGWESVAAVASAVAGVPAAAVRVVLALFRAGRRKPRGSICAQRADRDRGQNAAAATRRAVALLALSLAPDKFAVRDEGSRLAVHCIGARRRDRDGPWPA